MLIVLLILSILFMMWLCYVCDELGGFAIIFPAVCLFFLIGNITKIVDGRIIDDQIALYTEENAKIETAIDELVTEYMEFESNTFIELKNDSSITLVSLYPELKSDELVKAQIETYQANNSEIKRLKEKKLKITTYKWWVYFGK